MNRRKDIVFLSFFSFIFALTMYHDYLIGLTSISYDFGEMFLVHHLVLMSFILTTNKNCATSNRMISKASFLFVKTFMILMGTIFEFYSKIIFFFLAFVISLREGKFVKR